MNDTFIFDLKLNRNRKFLRIGWFLLILNTFFFALILRGDPEQQESPLIPILLASFLLAAALKLFYKPTAQFEPKLLSVVMLVAALGWWLLEQTLPSLGHLLLAFIGWRLPARACIRFHKTGITIPAMPSRTFEWEKIEQAIWKDGLLTIDFKNNVLIQEETSTTLNAAEQQQFQAFVKTMTADRHP